MAQFSGTGLSLHKIIDHQLVHPDLLVDPSDHHLLIDRLVIPAYKIPVKIHIQIVHGLYMGKRLVHKNVVHIKSMFGKLQAALAQQLCAVNHGMHEDVLPQHKHLHIFPGKHLVLGQSGPVIHDLLPPCPLLLIYKIGNEHIHRLRLVREPPQHL